MNALGDATKPVVIVGAGAAGLAASIFAARAYSPVMVIERTADGGRKILISGGGRCNVLPAALEPERFVTDSPAHLLRGLLRSWPLHEQRAFFERDVGIPLKLEEASRKLFPLSDRARDVRDGLVALARREGVEFQFDTSMRQLEVEGDGLRLHTSRGVIDAAAVILATGGLSVPKTGSTGDGLGVASTLGHRVHATYPALTPITDTGQTFADLAGISLPVRLKARSSAAESHSEGGFLFTHRGYSGPSVLDVSHVVVRHSLSAGERPALRVSWTQRSAEEWRADFAASGSTARSAVGRHLPQRLADRLVVDAGIAVDRPAAQLSRVERARLIERLTACELPWTGDEGYAKAEVTGGGVALDEVDRRTLESRRCPRVYLCGELLDAFGPIGGHNFAWAWATGRLAGAAAGAAARTGT